MPPAISVRTVDELQLMKSAGAIVGNTLEAIRFRLQPGVTTSELDDVARYEINSSGGRPSFPEVVHPELGTTFPGAICASVNDEIVHGIPSDRELREGDVVSIDVGVIFEGMHADGAKTFGVGRVSDEASRLLEATEQALRRGIDRVRPGRGLYEISEAIDDYATAKGLGIVKKYVGHGIGKEMHEPPQIPNYRMSTRGPTLRNGWTLAVEPMLNIGTPDTRILADGWTVVTADGSLSAHFEHTVAVTSSGHSVLTLPGEFVKGNVR